MRFPELVSTISNVLDGEVVPIPTLPEDGKVFCENAVKLKKQQIRITKKE